MNNSTLASPSSKSMSPVDALVHYSKCLLESEKTEILDYSSVINNINIIIDLFCNGLPL